MSVSDSILEFGPITTAIVFGIIQAIYIICFFSLKGRFSQHKFLVYLTGALLIMQVESFFLQSGYMSLFPHIFLISIPFIFLLGPLAYFYTIGQLKLKGTRTDFLHFLPFVFYFLYSFNFYFQKGIFKKFLYLMEFRPEVDVVPIPIAFPTDPWNIQGLVVVEFLSIHLFAYGLMSILSVLKTRKRKNDIEQENLYWLYYINSILMIGALVLFFSQGGVIDGHEFFTPPFPRYSADLFSVVAMYLIVFYLLIKKGHFKFSSKKYSKSSLSSFYKREKLNQIIQLIEDNKLYLNTGFSLRMLSERSGLSMHKISQILNEELHVNFVDLTNKYRIEEAKKRLLSDDFDSKMEQLAYDIGYKSKSTFFTLFKKETNSTPSNFRKNSRI